jgi:hypothetical protein
VTSLPVSGESEWLTTYLEGTTDSIEDSYVEVLIEAHAQIVATHKWQRLVLDPGAPVDVDAISETVDAIYEVIDAYGPAIISFEDVRSERVQGEHLAAALRATSPWRQEILGWQTALDVARDALASGGVDPNDALYGLIENE